MSAVDSCGSWARFFKKISSALREVCVHSIKSLLLDTLVILTEPLGNLGFEMLRWHVESARDDSDKAAVTPPMRRVDELKQFAKDCGVISFHGPVPLDRWADPRRRVRFCLQAVMSARFRTSLHGTCLLDGKHPPGSKYARECPVLRRQRKVQTPQDDAKSGSQGVDSGSPTQPPASPHQSGHIGQVDVTLHRGGRPRKHPDARTAHVAAQRAYRARQKAER